MSDSQEALKRANDLLLVAGALHRQAPLHERQRRAVHVAVLQA